MATIKLGTTKVANKLISYAEKKAIERDGVDCDASYAKTQFKATRELYGKNEGIQAHHVIQSFAPGEVSASQANEVGLDLAKKIAPGHEVVVYTHADKAHIHNHIIINSVNYKDGKKLQLHGKQAINKVRQMSDDICRGKGLSVVQESTSKVRYTLAEKSLIEKGQASWKDELRQAIDLVKKQSNSYESFKENLKQGYDIDVNDKGKHITYKHPDHSKVVRGNKLGLDYERGTIENGFSRQIEREQYGTERGRSLLHGGRDTSTERVAERGVIEFNNSNKRVEQPDAELHKGSHERGYSQKNNAGSRANKNSEYQRGSTKENAFDIEIAREFAEGLRKQVSQSFGEWEERNSEKQLSDITENGRDRSSVGQKNERGSEEHGRKLERVRSQEFELDR